MLSLIIGSSSRIAFSLPLHRMSNARACRSLMRSAHTSSSFSGWDRSGRDSLKPLTSDPMDVYVVSSASRGIGLEFAKQLLQRTQESRVIGLARNIENNSLIASLAKEFPDRFISIKCDTTSQTSVEAAGKDIKEYVNAEGRSGTVKMLFNVAGVLGDGVSTPGPERSLSKMNRDWLMHTLDVNLVGHVMVSANLMPLLKGDRKKGTYAKVVNLSARVGSIQDNGLGGWYSYRMSKSALNQFTKTMSIEAKRYRCLTYALHPGTTDTDLSVPFQKNVADHKLFPVWYSVGCMLDVVWNLGEAETGGFYAYNGEEIPW